MPSPQKPSVDPAAIHERLLATLMDLQSQRDALVRSFPTYVDKVAEADPTSNTSTEPVSDMAQKSATTEVSESALTGVEMNNRSSFSAHSPLDPNTTTAPSKLPAISSVTNELEESQTRPIEAECSVGPDQMGPVASTGDPSTIAIPILSAVTPTDIDEALALARSTIKRHIHLLHSYNEIRDVGQGLFGIIAEQKGVRIVKVMEEFGVGNDD